MITSPITSQAAPAAPVSAQKQQQIQKVAKEFEAMFSSMFVRAMRGTVGDNPLLPASIGTEIFTDMLDTEYSKMLGPNAKVGLADLIVKQLQRSGQASDPLEELHNLSSPSQPWMLDNSFVPSSTGSSASSSENLSDLFTHVSKFEKFIAQASAANNVDKNLVSAVIAQESAGDPNAKSTAGAKGLMQLMDTTSQDMGVTQPFSAQANINAGTKYLRTLLDKFNGNEKLALASYNAGPAAVEKYQGVPPYQETRQYVDSVLKLKQNFAKLQGNQGR